MSLQYDAAMPELPVMEPSETRIDEPEGSLAALRHASDATHTTSVAAQWPECLAAWAALGEAALAGNRPVDAYAFFRVGYHRGLDRIRGAGWRGSGRVSWSHDGNRGFLRSLRGLSEAAEALGEEDEAARCRDFLHQLAPDAPAP
ncbi:DUF3151 domain-containing protein [soil metagenome]